MTKLRSNRLANLLLLSTAMAGVAPFLAAPAGAQTLPVVTPGGDGGATITTTGGNTMTVDIGAQSRVINWNSFSIGGTQNESVTFQGSTASNYAVLNRVAFGGPASQIDGALNSQSNIAVWLINPQGIVFGSTGTFNGSSLVLSTLDLDPSKEADFLAGNPVTLTGGAGGVINIAGGIQSTGAVALIAQKIDTTGSIVGSGDVALIAASDVTLPSSLGSPLSFTINAGTTVGSAHVTAGGTITGASVKLAGASATTAISGLLNVDSGATLTATAADGALVIATKSVTSRGITIAGAPAAGGIDARGTLRATGTNGDVIVASNAAAGVAGSVNAARDYVVGGSAVTLGGNGIVQSAGGRVDVTAGAGGIVGAAGTTLTANADGTGSEALVLDATGGDITFGLGSVLNGGPAQQSNIGIRLGSAGALTLDKVSAAKLVSVGADHTTFDTSLGNNVGTVVLGNVDTVNTLDVRASGSITTGALTVTGLGQGVSLQTLTADQDITTGAIKADSAITLNATRDILTTSATTTDGSVSMTARRSVGGQGGGRTDITAGGAARDVSVTASSGQAMLGTVSAGHSVTVTAATGIDAVTTNATNGDIAFEVAGAGDAKVGDLTAGRSIGIRTTAGHAVSGGTLLAGEDIGISSGATISFTKVQADDDVDLAAGGDVTIGTVAARGTGSYVDTRHVDLSAGVAFTAGEDAAHAGSSVRIKTPGLIQTGTGSAANDILLDGGTLDIGNQTAGRSIVLRASGALAGGTLIAGEDVAARASSIDIFSAQAGDDIDLQATNLVRLAGGATTGAANVDSRYADFTGSTLGFNAGELPGNTGINLTLISAAGDVVAGENGLTGFANATLTATAGNVRLGTVTTINGSIGITAAHDVTGLAGASTGTSDALFGRGNLTAFDTLDVKAGGLVQLGTVTARNALTVTAGSLLPLSNGSIDIASATSLLGDLTLTARAASPIADAAHDGDILLGTGNAAGLVTIRNDAGTSGDVAITNSVTGGTVQINSANNVLLREYSPLVPTTGFVRATSGSLSITAAKSVYGLTGSATMVGETGVGSAYAGGSLTLTAAGDARIDALRAAGSISMNVAGSLTGRGPTLGVNVPGGALFANNVAGQNISVTAGNVALINTISATGTVALNAPQIAVGALDADRAFFNGSATVTDSGLYLGAIRTNGNLTILLSGPVAVTPVVTTGNLFDGGFGRTNVSSTLGSVTGTINGAAQLGTVSANGLINLSAGGLSILSANAGTSLDLTATTGTLVLGDGAAGTDARLTKQAGSIATAGDELRVTGTLRAGTTNNVAGLANLTSSTHVRAANVIAAGGDVTLIATDGEVTGIGGAGANLTAAPQTDGLGNPLPGTGGSIYVTSGQLSRLGTLDAGEAITVTAGDSLVAGHAGAIRLVSANTARGDITLNVFNAGPATANGIAAGTVTAARNAALNTLGSNGGDIVADRADANSGDLVAKSQRDITFNVRGLAGRSIALLAGRNLTAPLLTAGEDIGANASNLIRVSSLTAGDDIDLSAATIQIDTAIATGLGPDTSSVNLALPTPFNPTELADHLGANITLTSSGATSVSTLLDAARSVRVNAGTLANIFGDVTARSGDYTVTGGTGVVLGDGSARLQQAAGMVSVTATTGDVGQGSGRLTLLSNSDRTPTAANGAPDPLSITALAGNIVLGNSALIGGSVTGHESEVRLNATAGSVTLDAVDGQGISIRARDGIAANTLAAGNATRAVDPINGFSTIDLLSTNGPITLGTATATGTGHDITLVSANGAVTTRGLLDAGRHVTVNAKTIASVLGDVTARSGDYTVTGGTGVVLGDGSARLQQAAGMVSVTATTGDVGQGSGRLTLLSNSDRTPTAANGAPDPLSVTALAGNIVLGNSALIGGSVAGHESEVRLNATAGSVTLDAVDGQGISIRARDGIAANTLAAGNATRAVDPVNGFSTIDLASSAGGITLGSATTVGAGHDITLSAPGAVSATTLNSSRDISAISTAQDVVIVAGTAQRNIGVQAAGNSRTGGLTAVSGAINVTAGTGDATGLVGASIGTSDTSAGRAQMSAATTINVTAAGLAQLGTARAGTGLVVVAGNATRNGAIDVTQASTTTGDLRLDARAISASDAVRDGHIFAGSVTAGAGNVTLTNVARGGTTGDVVVGTGAAGSDLTVASARNTRAGSLTANGTVSVSAGGDATGLAGLSNGTTDTGYGRAQINAGAKVAVNAGGLVQFGVVTAGTGISVVAGASGTTPSNGAIDITSLSTTAGDLSLDAYAASGVDPFRDGHILIGNATATAGKVTLTNTARGGTQGDIAVADFATAGSDLGLSAARDVRLNNGTAAGSGTVIAGRNATVTGTSGLTSTGTASVQAGGAAAISLIKSNAANVAVGAGTVNIGAADAKTALSVTASGGNLTLGTGIAGGTAGLSTTGGNGDVTVTGSLVAGQATTITSVRHARLALVKATTGDLKVTAAGEVTGSDPATGANLEATAGAVSVNGGPLARLGTVKAGTTIGVSAGTVSTGGLSSGGATTLTASGGPLTVGSIVSGGDVTMSTTSLATLGPVTATGRTITLTAADAALNDTITGQRIVIVDRSAGNALRLGDGAPGTGGFELTATEINRLKAADVVLDAGTSGGATAQNVALGALALAADTGSNSFQIYGTQRIDMTGAFTAAGSSITRTIRFGGTASSGTRAQVIRIAATPTGGGSIDVGQANLDLRGDRIGIGQDAGFLTALGLAPDSTGSVSAQQVATDYVGRANSSLYNAGIGGVNYTTPRVLVTARTLTLRFSDYALVQNTSNGSGQTGVVIGGSTASPVSNAIQLFGPNPPDGVAVGLFGTVNGVPGSAAALLGPSIIGVTAVNRNNARLNGCVIGAAGSCIANQVSTPIVGLFDPSRADVFKTSSDFELPFDPIVGTNNESLFGDVGTYGLGDIPAVEPNCPPDDKNCHKAKETAK